MPLPPPPAPAPLPRLMLRSQSSLYQSPNPLSFGAVRAAALAARQARQFRLKKQEQCAELRVASPPASQCSVPFHEKKHLKLHLNIDAVTKPEPPPMFASPFVPIETAPTTELGWEAMKDEERTQDRGGATNAMRSAKRPSAFRSRRKSSITLSLNSPEGAEFQEVAHDGPEQLGRLTKRVKKVGKGAGGVVFLSLYLPTLKLVAVKEVVVYKEQVRELVKHELHALHENLVPIDSAPAAPVATSTGVWTQLRQLSGMTKPTNSSISCPYLVAFYGAYLLPVKCAISIVMEFMDMGSLQDLLDAHVSIPEPVLRHCAFCCMSALERMHCHRMIHRDIKPANILMNSKGEFKIADFGLAGTLSKSESFFSEFEGTMMYMAPERIQGRQYSHASDLWSMGVSLFYLATGSYPFAVEDGFFGLEEAIVNDPLPPMPNRFSSECRDFIKSLLRRDPAKRMTAAKALSHPFLSGYKNSASFQTFPSLWEKMPLSQCPIAPEDVVTIAQLLADFTIRQEGQATRRGSGLPNMWEVENSSVGSGYRSGLVSVKHDAGTRSSQGGAEALRLEALSQLAENCGVSANDLHSLLEQALARQ